MKRSQRNSSAFTYETEMIRVDNDIAKKLVEEYNLNVKFARYHVDGNWYSMVNEFPVAFFDLYGYVIINSEHELRCEMDVKKRIHKVNGIHRMKNYVKFHHIPTSIENYHEIVENKKKINTEKFLELQNIMKKSLNGQSSMLKI